jgi:hypothetical protein
MSSRQSRRNLVPLSISEAKHMDSPIAHEALIANPGLERSNR